MYSIKIFNNFILALKENNDWKDTRSDNHKSDSLDDTTTCHKSIEEAEDNDKSNEVTEDDDKSNEVVEDNDKSSEVTEDNDETKENSSEGTLLNKYILLLHAICTTVCNKTLEGENVDAIVIF